MRACAAAVPRVYAARQGRPPPEPHASGVAIAQWHTPASQCWPGAQALPHAPQLFASLRSSVQNAPAPLPHASGVDGAQPHLPSLHCCPGAHAWSHAPQ